MRLLIMCPDCSSGRCRHGQPSAIATPVGGARVNFRSMNEEVR